MVENISKTEYEQKQRQNYLIDMTRRRKIAEEEQQEEDIPEYYADNVSYLPEEQNLQTKVKHKQRLSWFMGMALISTAGFVDILELLFSDTGLDAFALGSFSMLLSIAASFLFYVWFHILGVPYSSNTKKFWAGVVTSIAEIFPGLDFLQFWFVWTLGMIVIVGMVRMEDKGEEPSITGGLVEGLSLVLLNPLNPVAIPIGIALSGVNKARRFAKRRAGVGQADWVKEEEEQKRDI